MRKRERHEKAGERMATSEKEKENVRERMRKRERE